MKIPKESKKDKIQIEEENFQINFKRKRGYYV